MKSTLTMHGGALSEPRPRPSLVDRLARRFVHRALASLRRGRVRLVEGTAAVDFGPGDTDETVRVEVRDPRAYRAILVGGTIGAAEAYMDGAWTCDDLAGLVRLVAASEGAHYGLEGGVARLAAPLRALRHRRRGNTRRGSRRNIAAHYDLGNELFRLFLDETLTYSCGIFERPGATMVEASIAKFDRIARRLALGPSDHLLEIGTGWGGFAIHAARRYGCRVTTTTISREQHELARERVRRAGLVDRVRLLAKDYRELAGTYDKLVSIEMIEAVGAEHFEVFFAKCASLLRPEGSMLLQSITIADQDFERHRRDVDFIKQYIFPGACIPSVTALVDAATRVSDLRLFELTDITEHYVTTLRRWREKFVANRDEVRRLGASERFLRMWEFYLGYCEGGFAERYLGDVQMTFVKPGWRPGAARP